MVMLLDAFTHLHQQSGWTSFNFTESWNWLGINIPFYANEQQSITATTNGSVDSRNQSVDMY